MEGVNSHVLQQFRHNPCQVTPKSVSLHHLRVTTGHPHSLCAVDVLE